MTGLSKIRRKMRTRGRLVLGVFVIAWMNATLLPCAMAMEMSPSELASVSASAQHGGHHGHSDESEDRSNHACPHCPPSTSHDSGLCDVEAASECDTLPEVKPGERLLKVNLSDTFDDAHSSYQSDAPDRVTPLLVNLSPNCEKPTFVVGPSINIRNCVFLK